MQSACTDGCIRGAARDVAIRLHPSIPVEKIDSLWSWVKVPLPWKMRLKQPRTSQIYHDEDHQVESNFLTLFWILLLVLQFSSCGKPIPLHDEFQLVTGGSQQLSNHQSWPWSIVEYTTLIMSYPLSPVLHLHQSSSIFPVTLWNQHTTREWSFMTPTCTSQLLTVNNSRPDTLVVAINNHSCIQK